MASVEQRNPDMAVDRMMKRATPVLSDEEAKAYAAPFPGPEYKMGVRTFPNLVPDKKDAPGAEISRRALDWWKNKWSGQSFMAIGMKDPILGPKIMSWMRMQIKGCPPPFEVNEAGHFVQEWGEEIAHRALISFGLFK